MVECLGWTEVENKTKNSDKKLYRQPHLNIKGYLWLLGNCVVFFFTPFSKIFPGHVQPIEMLCLGPSTIFKLKKVHARISLFQLGQGILAIQSTRGLVSP